MWMKTMDGEQLKLEGIAQAAKSAEENSPGWNVEALKYVRNYHKQRFMAEEIREWAHECGLPEPPSARAWGAVIVTAKNAGLIKHAGYAAVENPKAHRTPASVWEKVR